MISDKKARLEQLTTWAQCLWDDEENIVVSEGFQGADTHSAYVKCDSGVLLTIAAPNDRALDALEAALRAMLKDPSDPTVYALQAELERRDQVLENLVAELKALPEHKDTLVFHTTVIEQVTDAIIKRVWPERA